MNAFDSVLKGFVNRFLTTDEWHTVVVGFCDGLSLSMEGKYFRRGLAKPGVDVENVDTEKVWYFKAPYVAGEMTKLFILYFVLR